MHTKGKTTLVSRSNHVSYEDFAEMVMQKGAPRFSEIDYGLGQLGSGSGGDWYGRGGVENSGRSGKQQSSTISFKESTMAVVFLSVYSSVYFSYHSSS